MTTPTVAPTISAWKLNASHTHAEFAVKHLMITTVKGRFQDVEGTIELDEQQLERSKVSVTIKAATIDTRDERRDAHLRSGDFLEVEHHPNITFASTRVQRGAGVNAFTVTGDLTIRGVTKPVTLAVTSEGRVKDPWGGERVGFSATAKFDRREFGLIWNQALEAGGIAVGNEVKVAIEVEAVRATD